MTVENKRLMRQLRIIQLKKELVELLTSSLIDLKSDLENIVEGSPEWSVKMMEFGHFEDQLSKLV